MPWLQSHLDDAGLGSVNTAPPPPPTEVATVQAAAPAVIRIGVKEILITLLVAAVVWYVMKNRTKK
jgi:hypothetical protein